MGSLIKNPGGTVAPGGGYVAGRRDLVEAALARMSAPGVGADAGCVPGETLRLLFQGLRRAAPRRAVLCCDTAAVARRPLQRCPLACVLPCVSLLRPLAHPPTQTQSTHTALLPPHPLAPLPAGLFLAPQMVGEALKGGRLVAEVLSREGLAVVPRPGPCAPWSFITAAQLGAPEQMQAFCEAVQACCPVGSYIRPVPGEQDREGRAAGDRAPAAAAAPAPWQRRRGGPWDGCSRLAGVSPLPCPAAPTHCACVLSNRMATTPSSLRPTSR